MLSIDQLESEQARFMRENPNPACIFEEYSNDPRDQTAVRWCRWSDLDPIYNERIEI